jgi:hypothetical protein
MAAFVIILFFVVILGIIVSILTPKEAKYYTFEVIDALDGEGWVKFKGVVRETGIYSEQIATLYDIEFGIDYQKVFIPKSPLREWAEESGIARVASDTYEKYPYVKRINISFRGDYYGKYKESDRIGTLNIALSLDGEKPLYGSLANSYTTFMSFDNQKMVDHRTKTTPPELRGYFDIDIWKLRIISKERRR